MCVHQDRRIPLVGSGTASMDSRYDRSDSTYAMHVASAAGFAVLNRELTAHHAEIALSICGRAARQ